VSGALIFATRLATMMAANQTESGTAGFQVNAHLKDIEEEVCIPTCCFSSCFDAFFGFVGANEAKREAANDGHVLAPWSLR
jgi:hypothetical protein